MITISFDLDGTLVTDEFSQVVWHQGIPELYAQEYGCSFDEAQNIIINEYNKVVTAILALLPGTAILINNSLRYEEKTKWFWKKVRISEKLLRRLRDSSNPNIEEISSQFSEKMEELESEWPAMDSPAKQPKK